MTIQPTIAPTATTPLAMDPIVFMSPNTLFAAAAIFWWLCSWL
jgi:hypothetical protein